MKRFQYTFPAGSYQLCSGETEHSEPAVAVVPGLIVVGSKGRYRVTHGPSGRAASSYLDRLSDAVAIAEQLGKLCDWRAQDMDAVIKERGLEFSKRLRRVSQGKPACECDKSDCDICGPRIAERVVADSIVQHDQLVQEYNDSGDRSLLDQIAVLEVLLIAQS